jgi:hypothetical protein
MLLVRKNDLMLICLDVFWPALMLFTAASCPGIYLLIAEYFDERLVMAASSGSVIAPKCTVRDCGVL